jgi:adenylate cyclase
MRAIGKDKSKYNPNFCTECEDFVRKYNAGTEVDLSLLFADIRGSTTLAEEMSAPEFSSLINRFYTVTSKILVQAMAYIDKLAGDQVSAFFSPGMAGPHHYEIALDSARAILEATGHSDPGGPWVPVGIGVHGGQTYFGAVGSAQELTDLTILGDPPNTAARLASTAKAGEILVSQVAAEKAELDTAGLEKRSLELKGKTETVDVWVLAAHTK